MLLNISPKETNPTGQIPTSNRKLTAAEVNSMVTAINGLGDTVANVLGGQSLKSFGVKGDGVTDDTEKFQLALDAGVPLRAEFGDIYLINGGLVSNTDNFELLATGATFKLKPNATNRGMLTLNGVGSRVVGGTWDGNKANGNGGTFIWDDEVNGKNPYGAFNVTMNADYCIVDGINSINGWGIGVKGESGVNFCKVINCNIKDVELYGIFIGGNDTNEDHFGNSAMNNNIDISTGGNFAQGILFTSNRPLGSQKKFNISFNNIKHSSTVTLDQAICIAVRGDNGLYIGNQTEGGVMGISEGGDNTLYSGNIINNVVGAAYGIEPNGSNCTFTGNIINGAREGFSLSNANNTFDNLSFLGNVIEARIGYNIQIDQSKTGRNISIYGDTIKFTYRGISTTYDITGLSVDANLIGPGSGVTQSRGIFLDKPPVAPMIKVRGRISNCEIAYSAYSLAASTIGWLDAIDCDVSFGVQNQGWGFEGAALCGFAVKSQNLTGLQKIINQATDLRETYSDSVSNPNGVFAYGGASIVYSMQTGKVWTKTTGAGNNQGWVEMSAKAAAVADGSTVDQLLAALRTGGIIAP